MDDQARIVQRREQEQDDRERWIRAREKGVHEAERLADRREGAADERDAIADEREREANERERNADEREHDADQLLVPGTDQVRRMRDGERGARSQAGIDRAWARSLRDHLLNSIPHNRNRR